jgi:AraC-like DNA-binding protein
MAAWDVSLRGTTGSSAEPAQPECEPSRLARPDADTRVSAIHLRGLLEAVEIAGLGVDHFCLRNGFDASSLRDDPYGSASLADLDRLTCLAVSLSGDPAFGLHWGERSPMFGFDVVSMLFTQAPSPRAGFEALLRCQSILGDHEEVTLEERGRVASLRFHPLALSTVAARVRTETCIAGFARLFGYTGVDVMDTVERVDLAYARPEHGAEYERLFGNRCRFGQAVSGFEFDRAWLDRPLHGNGELHQVIVSQADRVLGRVRASTTLSQQLRGRLRLSFPELPPMPAVARALGWSERSLRRRLQEEGLSYSQILQETQCNLAEELLQDRSRSIQQVAADAGFASVTAFHRAFKRWTGKSPASYRERSSAQSA